MGSQIGYFVAGKFQARQEKHEKESGNFRLRTALDLIEMKINRVVFGRVGVMAVEGRVMRRRSI